MRRSTVGMSATPTRAAQANPEALYCGRVKRHPMECAANTTDGARRRRAWVVAHLSDLLAVFVCGVNNSVVSLVRLTYC